MEPTKSVKTRIEIIDWIAGFYNLNNRSVDDTGLCLYNGPDGKHCAMAMMCVDTSEFKEFQQYGYLSGADIARFHPEYLKAEFTGHLPGFYADIQCLHDNEGYWTKAGLSDLGRHKVLTLKTDWA